MSFQEADEFNALHGNQFIADLMPKHPVYVAMLSDAAKNVIGLPHPSGRAAMRMLENEGFAFENYVDIFDGGPTMTARTDAVKTVRDARTDAIAGLAEGGARSLVATGTWRDFRCAFGAVGDADGGVTLNDAAVDALGVDIGDNVDWIAS